MMLGFFVLLLGWALGNAVAFALHLPVPGAVLGMAALSLGIVVARRTPAGIERAADGLLQLLPMLFVPAGVGVVQFLRPLRSAWLPTTLALVLGTLLTVAVTALVLRGCVALQRRGRPEVS